MPEYDCNQWLIIKFQSLTECEYSQASVKTTAMFPPNALKYDSLWLLGDVFERLTSA